MLRSPWQYLPQNLPVLVLAANLEMNVEILRLQNETRGRIRKTPHSCKRAFVGTIEYNSGRDETDGLVQFTRSMRRPPNCKLIPLERVPQIAPHRCRPEVRYRACSGIRDRYKPCRVSDLHKNTKF